MKKQLPIILSICIVVSLSGNLYLYNQQQQLATQVGNLTAEIVTTTESTQQFEQEAIKAQQELDDANAQYKLLENELAELKDKVAKEAQKPVEDTKKPIVNESIKDDKTVIDGGELPKGKEDPTGSAKIGTRVPGATHKEQSNGLKPGQAMDQNGNYISPDKVGENCYVNIDGQLYGYRLGELRPAGPGATYTESTYDGPIGPSGESWID